MWVWRVLLWRGGVCVCCCALNWRELTLVSYLLLVSWSSSLSECASALQPLAFGWSSPPIKRDQHRGRDHGSQSPFALQRAGSVRFWSTTNCSVPEPQTSEFWLRAKGCPTAPINQGHRRRACQDVDHGPSGRLQRGAPPREARAAPRHGPPPPAAPAHAMTSPPPPDEAVDSR